LEQFVDAFHKALFTTGLRVTLGRLAGFAPTGAHHAACARIYEYLDFCVDKALDTRDGVLKSERITQKQSSMIEGLAAQTDDKPYMRSQILQGMMASQDTTAVLISNTIFLLSRHLQIWDELQLQISQLADRIYSFNELSDFTFPQNILKECKYGVNMMY
jgi:cytochrome P450